MTETEIRESTATAPWPSPEQAYEHAPDIAHENGWLEIGWTEEVDGVNDRAYCLRLAALLDRIALRYAGDGIHDQTAEEAHATAVYLVDVDRARTPATEADPRGYVRREYAHWIAQHRLTTTAESSHDDCTVCAGEGTTLWVTPEGGEEIRPCTGSPYEDMLAARLVRQGQRTRDGIPHL